MDSAELMKSSFGTFLQRAESIAMKSLEADVGPGTKYIGDPKGQGSLFQKAHEVIVEMSKESLPETITRLISGLDEITEDFFDGKSGLYAALEAAQANDHLKEAMILSCFADPNIRRALQIGLWAAELATRAKSRHAETAYSIGVAMQHNAERGAKATRKEKPTKIEFEKALKAARARYAKESAVDAELGSVFDAGPSKVREWKKEFDLLKRSKKTK